MWIPRNDLVHELTRSGPYISAWSETCFLLLWAFRPLNWLFAGLVEKSRYWWWLLEILTALFGTISQDIHKDTIDLLYYQVMRLWIAMFWLLYRILETLLLFHQIQRILLEQLLFVPTHRWGCIWLRVQKLRLHYWVSWPVIQRVLMISDVSIITINTNDIAIDVLIV